MRKHIIVAWVTVIVLSFFMTESELINSWSIVERTLFKLVLWTLSFSSSYYFTKIVIKRGEAKEVKTINDEFSYEAFERELIQKVIAKLKEKPESFSAMWSNSKTLDKSIRSSDKKILIMFSGQIISPIEPKMSDEDMRTLRELIIPIVRKESQMIVNSL